MKDLLFLIGRTGHCCVFSVGEIGGAATYDSLCELGTPLLNKTQQIITKPDIRSKEDHIYMLLYQCPYRWGSFRGETCGRTGTGS